MQEMHTCIIKFHELSMVTYHKNYDSIIQRACIIIIAHHVSHAS